MGHLLQGLHILLEDIKCLHLLDLKTSLENKQVIPPLSLCQTFMTSLSLTLEDSYDKILQTLLGTKFITFLKSSSYGNPFLNIYYSYHRYNEHSTSDYIDLKHKIQDLIDNRIIDSSNDSCNEDTSLEQDHVYEPMSNSSLLDISTSSNNHASLKNSNLSNMSPSNKESNAFHTDYAYSQGLPLK